MNPGITIHLPRFLGFKTTNDGHRLPEMRPARIRKILQQLLGTAQLRGMHQLRRAPECRSPVLPCLWRPGGRQCHLHNFIVALDCRGTGSLRHLLGIGLLCRQGERTPTRRNWYTDRRPR